MLCSIGLLHAVPVVAQVPAAAAPSGTLPTVVVTPIWHPVDAFAIPASVSVVDVPGQLRLGASPAELLRGVPGVQARERNNHAQDIQIAIRGFGARSAFGIRGVRLITDGIPATQPDGQGQVSHFNLASAERLDVLRGPFSVLSGNAAGGVIHLQTDRGEGQPHWRLEAVAGRFDSLRTGVTASGAQGGLDVHANLTRFASAGPRAHSRVLRHSANARIAHALNGGGELSVVVNALDQPWTDDPLGLTWTQFREDPHQVAAVATQFDTRKQVHQYQGGVLLDTPLGDAMHINAMLYGGSREVGQFLAVPPAAQRAPRHAGGVIDLGNGYGGGELRAARHWSGGAGDITLTGGIAVDTLRQRRRGFENHQGDLQGVRGALRRDERIRVDSHDPFLQVDWQPHARWKLLVGLRYSRVRMQVRDGYITADNPDDSGHVRYRAATPVVGIQFRPTPRLHLHIGHGRGFETPTIAEAAYRADGGSGLALDLAPARSRHLDIGGKWRSDRLQAELTLFRIDARNELAVATASGGRTTYQNIPGSRRDGVELALDWQPASGWRLQASHTWLDARFTRAFLGCGERCSRPDVAIAGGTRIPGIAEHAGWLALSWQPHARWQATLDAQATGRMTVDDAGSAHPAPGHVLLGAELVWHRPGRWRSFVRIDNLGNRDHVGSVIVNDGNGRHYEPGAGRTWLLGVQWNSRSAR